MFPLFRYRLLCVACLLPCIPLFSKEDPLEIGDKIFELEPFIIYESPIPVIDGITGKKYEGDNEVVLDFADTFNDLLLGYHKKLLIFEIRHLNFRLQDGKIFEKELSELAASFGIRGFKVNHDNWMLREIAIVHRLNNDPFFKIEALVVWDQDQLEKMLPAMPDTRYARDIRFNEQKGTWERRVLTEWKVSYTQSNPNSRWINTVNILKQQGLNLDTNEGFHIIDRGLTSRVYPAAFKDVKLTYPVFFSSKATGPDEVKRLQEIFVKNLYHIYDPFSWVARRNTRFRGGFSNDLTRHFQAQRSNITDRDWFDPVLCNLLSDVITIKHHGTQEIYSLTVTQRFKLSENILGEGLDLLNWHKGEKRQGSHKKENAKIWLNFKSPGGARFIVLDAYMRYTDQFLNALRHNLLNAKKKSSGREIIEKTIEEVSGVPFKLYLKNAIEAQTRQITKYREE